MGLTLTNCSYVVIHILHILASQAVMYERQGHSQPPTDGGA